MRKNSHIATLLFLMVLIAGGGAGHSRASGDLSPEYARYTSTHGTFSCEIPKNWQVFEMQTPSGISAHALGPTQGKGAWRTGLHVHYVESGRPGFIPAETMLKRERSSDSLTQRESTGILRWRMGRSPARRFEVTETRWLPPESLPSQPSVLHHYYALIPSGGSYFIVKLSTTRETYLAHRETFDHVLSTFQVMSFPN